MLRCPRVLLISCLTLLLTAPLLCGQDAGSHARIVRISYVEGTVKINGEPATINSPIRGGVVLATETDGLAEVQFEDGSVIRMASETQITFAQLARLTSGDAITRVDLDDGEAEFLIPASSAGHFAVDTRSNKNVMFRAAGRFRVLSTSSSPLEIAVWKGEAAVRDRESGQEVAVRKDETFTLNASDPGQYDLENALLADDLDQWSSTRDQTLASGPIAPPSYTSTYGYAATSATYAPVFPYGAYGAYGAYSNCSPWAFGWGWQPPLGLYPASCWNSGFSFPWIFFPPTNVFVTSGPIVIPRRPPHLRPPSVPLVASGATLAQSPAANPHPPHLARPLAGIAEPAAESAAVAVKPGVHSFRFAGFQRAFNDDNFQRSIPRVDSAPAGETPKTEEKAQAPVPGAASEGHSPILRPLEPLPLVAPGHRSAGNSPATASGAVTTAAPSTPVPHSSAPPTPSRSTSPPRSSSPPASSGSHGFSGGAMPSHFGGSGVSHSSGGGGGGGGGGRH